jgi:branched-chain amino acid transport system ATP-binding protein
MLQVEDIQVAIDSVKILRGVSLRIGQGEMVGIIGNNGAGKTTTLRAVMGLARLGGGRVVFKGDDISRLEPFRRARLGLGYMPEDRRLIPQLTVEENMALPAWENKALDEVAGLALVYELMPELLEMKQRKALLLSGGQQKMVALGRALVAGTELLLLDEPFEGVAPALAQRLIEVIANLRAHGRSIIIAHSDLSHEDVTLDREYRIERGAII